MLLSDTHLRISLGANLTTEDPNTSGSAHIGRDILTLFPTADIAYACRFTMNGGDAALNPSSGQITRTAPPVAQVDTATIIAAAGCTSNGNLTVTITSAYLDGSPLDVTVPLTTAAHTTADLIAAAVRTALAANADIAANYTVGGTGADVTLTRPLHLYGEDDSTLNIAIAAARGVSAAVASADTVAGVAGASWERLSSTGDPLDMLGTTLPTAASLLAIAAFNDGDGGFVFTDADSVKCAPDLAAGEFWVLSGQGIRNTNAMDSAITIQGIGYLDLIVLATSTAP